MGIPVFIAAAVAEIAGCFAFWGYFRLGKPLWWLVPGAALLFAFASLLTLVPEQAAGRIFAAYGGIYIVTSLGWMWAVERQTPDRWDLAGALLCLAGALVILFGRRHFSG